jgi:glycosyltransferase involved in cell wall biosynthesis
MTYPPPVRVAVVIPALDEAENMSGLIADLRRALPDALVVVVDNGSTDGTAAAAVEAGAKALSEPERGYGSACLRGIRWLAERREQPEILVILDADRADDPGLLPDFVARIERGEADLVLSTRTRGGAADGAMTPIQIWGNRLQTAALRARFGLALTDMGPMRAVRFESLLALEMQDPTWGWNVEMVAKAARAGLDVVEVPVSYGQRRAGRSKISGSVRGAIRAGSKIIWALWRYAR